MVENDGIHSVRRRASTVYVKAGLHRIRLDWFNGPGRYGLQVDFAGPGVSHQRVPDSALFRAQPEPANGGAGLINGLDYRVFKGDWGGLLPSFRQLTPVKVGTAANFDIGVRTRDEHVGLEFTGYEVTISLKHVKTLLLFTSLHLWTD